MADTEVREHAHPTVDVYLRVAAALVILTVLEVGVFYVPAFHGVLVPVLLVLSAAKFALVIMFYMHLKADNKFFTFLFGAPLLLYGTPTWVVRPLLRPRPVMRFARWATRPLAAGVLFSAPITLWHFPQFYEAALEHHGLHVVQHLVFIATAVIMWWPVLSPVPELPRASYAIQLLYLFALGLPMSLAGALITLADRVLYPFYESAPRVWGLTPIADQQLGGLLMWVVGTIYLWVAATVVWFRWSAREESGDVEGAVPLEAYSTPPRPSPRGDARGGPL